MAIDREALILKAINRQIDDAIISTSQALQKTKRAAGAAGRLAGGATIAELGDACASGFQLACINALEKVQFEDREGALELADLVRSKILTPKRRQFADLYVTERVGPRPASGVDMKSGDRFRAQSEIDTRLMKLEANAVEEFQLAVTRQSPRTRAQVHMSTYVHLDRLEELRAKSSIAWDFSRLIVLCEEINTCWQYGAHHAVAMLTRSMLDHVPPIFEQKGFSGIAASYAGARSFKESMDGLDKMLRKIADAHLHTQIRDRESLPNANQVDFRPAIDVLLSEIVRIVP